jgi:hypothetical protein
VLRDDAKRDERDSHLPHDGPTQAVLRRENCQWKGRRVHIDAVGRSGLR